MSFFVKLNSMPTALELNRTGWKRYLEGGRARAIYSPLTPTKNEDLKQLLDRIQKAASLLKKRFGVRRVILFGSLAHAEWFDSDSDVDLAVEGLKGEKYWKAWQLVEEIIGDRLVDLIDFETAGNSLKKAIDRYGVNL